MKYTTNYNLKKPDETDFYSVEHANANMDAIDAALNAEAAAREDTCRVGIKNFAHAARADGGNTEGNQNRDKRLDGDGILLYRHQCPVQNRGQYPPKLQLVHAVLSAPGRFIKPFLFKLDAVLYIRQYGD